MTQAIAGHCAYAAGCGLLPSDDDFCALHSRQPDKSSSNFMDALRGVVAGGSTDFSGFVFPPDFEFPNLVLPARTGEKPRLDFTNATFVGQTSFSSLVLQAAVFSGVRFGGTTTFDHCQLLSKLELMDVACSDSLILTQTEFGGADNQEPACVFTTVHVKHRLAFDDCGFAADAVFKNVTCGQEFLCTTSRLERDFTVDDLHVGQGSGGIAGTVSFDDSTVTGNLTINGADFTSDVRFSLQRLLVEEHASLSIEHSSCVGGMSFAGTVASGQFRFSGVKVARVAAFARVALPATVFEDVSFLGSAQFDGADVGNAAFRRMSLRGAHLKNAINIDKAEFADISGWDEWPPQNSRPRLVGWVERRAGFQRSVVSDEVSARTSTADWTARRAELRAVERIYRAIRAGYEQRQDRRPLNDLYFSEMEMRRLATSDNALVRNLGSLDAWYGMVGAYGSRWIRPLSLFCLLWLACAAFYLYAGFWTKQTGVNSQNVSQTFLEYVQLQSADSARTLTNLDVTVGYVVRAVVHSFLVATFFARDSYASAATLGGLVVQSIETIVGPLLLGFVALAVQRRYTR